MMMMIKAREGERSGMDGGEDLKVEKVKWHLNEKLNNLLDGVNVQQ